MRDVRSVQRTVLLKDKRFRAALVGALATLAIPPTTLAAVNAFRIAGCEADAQAHHCRTPGLVGYYAALVSAGTAIPLAR